MNNVIPIDRPKVNKAQRGKANVRRSRNTRKEGGNALDSLNTEGKRLLGKDSFAMAKHIGEELDKLYQRGIKPGQVAYSAELANHTQELHRLCIMPGKNTPRLHKDPDKYVRLIGAIAKLLNEDVGTVADRILSGTSFHPSLSQPGPDEELVVTLLKEIVLRVEHDYHLFEKYRLTNELRAKYMKETGKATWPFYTGPDIYDLTPPTLESLRIYADFSVKEFKELGFNKFDRQMRLDRIDVTKLNEVLRGQTRYLLEEFGENHRNHLEMLRLQEHYWGELCEDEQPCYTELNWEEALLYIPHVYVGITIKWEEWHGFDAEKLSDRFEIENLRNDYAAISRKPPRIDKDTEGVMSFEENLCDKDKAYDNFAGSPHTWLIIYPNYQGTGLIPVLYTIMEEGGVQMVPITYSNLLKLKDYEVVYPGSHQSLSERILKLLGHGTGVNTVEAEWRRTAPFLKMNPYLAEEIRKQKNDAQFKKQVRKYMKRDKQESEND